LSVSSIVAGDVEPEVTGQGEQALQDLAVEFSGVLCGV